MSERIKPNAEHRIVDGEIIAGSIDEKIERGKAFSEDKLQNNSTDNSKVLDDEVNRIDNQTDPQAPITEGLESMNEAHETPKKAGFFSRYRSSILWLLLFIILLLALFLTRPNMDWQVQKINDLQSELAQLQQDNVALNQRIQDQNANIEQMVNDQVAKAIKSLTPAESKETDGFIRQNDLSTFEQQVQQQIERLQEKLVTLSGNAADQANQAISQLNQMADEAQKEVVPTDGQIEALKQLEEKIQNQMRGFGDKLAELFAFKTEQQVLTKEPSKLKLDMPLDSLQIQQWIVEVNTQWILNGRTDETAQQLLALEQAVSLSDFKYVTQLARLIGQDLGYLKQIEEQQLSHPTPDTSGLKQAVSALNANKISKESNDAIAAQNQPSEGLDGLLDRFSQLISITKRTDDAMTEVDGLLINDVLNQRLALLINRLDWGLQTHSKAVVQQSSQDIKSFIQRHYANELQEFTLLLEPFENVEFEKKKPLSIMKLDEAIENQ